MNEFEFLTDTIREQSIRGCRCGMTRPSVRALLGPELGHERRGKTEYVDFAGYREEEMLLVSFCGGVLESAMQDLATGVALSALSAALSRELVEAPSLRIGDVSLECADGMVVAVSLFSPPTQREQREEGERKRRG